MPAPIAHSRIPEDPDSEDDGLQQADWSLGLLAVFKIPLHSRHAFHDFAGLRNFMEESNRAFGGGLGTGPQFIGVTGISCEHVIQFDETRDTFPPVRITSYREEEQTMLLKLIDY